MATLGLFLTGVLSLIFFDPSLTAYMYADPSWLWRGMTAITSIVSHGNWNHLMGNFIFGGPYLLYLEYQLKDTKKFVRLFFLLGFIALFSQMIIEHYSIFKSVGAIGSSGAIFGVIGAALTLKKNTRFLTSLAIGVVLFFLVSQAFAAYTSLFFPMGVAYGAHLGGLIGGILFGLIHRRLNRRRRD